jgi:hypothetical protein
MIHHHPDPSWISHTFGKHCLKRSGYPPNNRRCPKQTCHIPCTIHTNLLPQAGWSRRGTIRVGEKRFLIFTRVVCFILSQLPS